MLYSSPQDYLNCPSKAVTLFGMSGVGKTTVTEKLPKDRWFHYSVDYRIGTRYLGEEINDTFKRLAMSEPTLARLLRADAIYIGSNIQIDNLAPLSTYVGKVGNPELGGLPLEEFKRRQALHRQAELQSLLDIPAFITKAQEIYGYPHTLVDSGGSLIEVIDLDDPRDPVVTALTQNTALIYIEASNDLLAEIVRRGIAQPKPMYFRSSFFDEALARYLVQEGLETAEQIVPNSFVAYVLEALVADRAPRYRRLAEQHGYIVSAAEISQIQNEADFDALVARAVGRRLTDDPQETGPQKTGPQETEPQKTGPQKTEPQKTEPQKTRATQSSPDQDQQMRAQSEASSA